MPQASPSRPQVIPGVSLLSEDDLFLFNEGTHSRLYLKLGAHLHVHEGVAGVYFAVWAPNADRVYVMGDFNDWRNEELGLYHRGSSGIWEGFVPGVGQWARYKFRIHSKLMGYRADKSDPFGFHHETPPLTASIVTGLDYQWGDAQWLEHRKGYQALSQPMSIYEVHLGSWMRGAEDNGRRYLTYRELAHRLADYCREMGFTHVEFLPVMEHPFYGSWGYQVTGFFAPTSRYGAPQDFMFLVDSLHQAGIGVILDWVPSHFPTDEHGLGFFDGTHLYEHSDYRQGFHPDWQSKIFNYDRHEVVSFLMSSAFFWLEVMHADGLRVDAVASMLYLDYSRKDGEWVPNKYGGKENLGAVDFLRQLNAAVYGEFPGVQTIAEESTSWPMVSRPAYLGGLGFGLKWDMGWMHDSLFYMARDPIHRKFHHNQLTFRMLYAWHENFVLPLSHDEVVHGKGSLLGKMPGDQWQRMANLRLLLGYMFGQAGKKLLFMGGEFGQYNEWYHEVSLDWHLLQDPMHAGMRAWVRDLNRAYQDQPALHQQDCTHDGFEWVDCNDSQAGVLSFLRKAKDARDMVLVVLNFTPVVRQPYRVGAPYPGFWREILNSDAWEYSGSGVGNAGGLMAQEIPCHGRPYSLELTLPPLGAVFFKNEG